MISFLVAIVAPLAIAADYLWTRAADQYASRVGFSVRQTQAPPLRGLSGLAAVAGIPALSGSAADDGNVLNEYLRSAEIVSLIDSRIGLRKMWSRPGAQADPVFAYHVPGTIEDLHDYWLRMVDVRYDPGPGLFTVEVRAFAPGDAQTIAAAIFKAAGERINALSRIAQGDTIQLAETDLSRAGDRLAAARAAMTGFRNRNQMIDPEASLQGQMGLQGQLEAELAQALIEHDMLVGTTTADDPRLQRLDRRVRVIRARLAAERARIGGADDAAYAQLVGDYEALSVEQRFAEEAWIAARSALDAARAEARRQTRYLAAYVPPTLAERAEYPKRARLLVILGAFLLLGWTLVVVTAYSLGDRR